MRRSQPLGTHFFSFLGKSPFFGSPGIWVAKLQGETKQDFFRNNRDTMGKDLNIKLREAITKQMSFRESHLFKVGGTYQEVNDLKEKLKDQPDKLANILAYGHRITCSVTKQEQVLVPRSK